MWINIEIFQQYIYLDITHILRIPNVTFLGYVFFLNCVLSVTLLHSYYYSFTSNSQVPETGVTGLQVHDRLTYYMRLSEDIGLFCLFSYEYMIGISYEIFLLFLSCISSDSCKRADFIVMMIMIIIIIFIIIIIIIIIVIILI